VAAPAAVEFYHRWDGNREPLMAAQIADFKQVQPNVTINQSMVIGSGEGYYDGMPLDKIISMVAAGNPPDVIMIDVRSTAEFGAKGALAPADELLKRDKIGLKETFYPASVALAQYEGKTVAMPQVVVGASHILWLNDAVWQASGLDVRQAPKTWDELLDACQKLTRRSGAGFDQIGGVFPGAFKAWAASNAVPFVSPDRKELRFNTPEAVATLEYMLGSTNRLYGSNDALGEWLRGVSGPASGGRTIAGAYGGFLNNRVGIHLDGNWIPFQVNQDNAQVKITGAMLPFNAKNPKARSSNLADAGWNYGLMTGSKQTAASWEWIKYICAGEGNARFFEAQGRPSVVRRFNDTPEKRRLPYWDVVVKTMEEATAIPMPAGWRRVDTLIGAMQADVMTGKLAPKQAVDVYVRRAQEELVQAAR
jgi:ABC-type glycerol-3-phosphate transport system substrate-binding protein